MSERCKPVLFYRSTRTIQIHPNGIVTARRHTHTKASRMIFIWFLELNSNKCENMPSRIRSRAHRTDWLQKHTFYSFAIVFVDQVSEPVCVCACLDPCMNGENWKQEKLKRIVPNNGFLLIRLLLWCRGHITRSAHTTIGRPVVRPIFVRYLDLLLFGGNRRRHRRHALFPYLCAIFITFRLH